MTTSELEQALRGAIAEVGQIRADFSADSDFYDELGLDSFRMVEIFLEVEKRFGVTISEDDYLNLRSLKHFLALVDKQQHR